MKTQINKGSGNIQTSDDDTTTQIKIDFNWSILLKAIAFLLITIGSFTIMLLCYYSIYLTQGQSLIKYWWVWMSSIIFIFGGGLILNKIKYF